MDRETCWRGHPLTPENVRPRTDRPGAVVCRACKREDVRRFRAMHPGYNAPYNYQARRRQKAMSAAGPAAGRAL